MQLRVPRKKLSPRTHTTNKMGMGIWLTILQVNAVMTLIAYDCQDPNLNITTYSLTDIGRCKITTDQISISNETIQLIQINDYEILQVMQCKIRVTRLISHCGMGSHMSAVVNGLATYLYPVNRNMCFEMHQRRALTAFYGKHIDHLVMNGTSYATVLMAGKMTSENSCQGGYYEDHKGSWNQVIVQASLEITLNERHVPANIRENLIVLPGGVHCPYKDKQCIDDTFGYTYWEPVDNFQCTNTKYAVIYEGIAKKLTPSNISRNNYEATIYSVDTEHTLFGMPVIKPTTICGQTAYETNHPKFFIVKPSEIGTFYFTKTKLNHLSLDPTAYTNSKFVFLEKHFRNQLTSMYAAVTAQKCELEQQVLKNLQTLAVTAPSEFAYAKFGPGYTALTYGEVIHVIQCTPVEVTIRTTKECYHELPVLYSNQTSFMVPRTRILQKYAIQLDCDSFLYPMYRFNEKWYKITQGLHETVRPHILQPYNNHDWTYKSPKNLFQGGLYSADEMETFQKHLLLPTERQAVYTILSRGMIGLDTNMQGTNLNNLVDENTIKHWLSKSWSSMWRWFSTLGTITAGFMGIYMITKGVKFIVDTLIHGTMLYELFGWSFMLLAAVVDSLTMYCVHRGSRRRNEVNEQMATVDTDSEITNLRDEESSPGENTNRNIYPHIPSDGMNNRSWLN